MLSLILHGWRSWKSAKPVALLAITALAVGIGSTTAIYAVASTALLKPLPYLHGERFVWLFGAKEGESGYSGLSWLDLLDYRQRTRSFDGFGIFQPRELNLTAPGEPRRLKAVEVTPSFASSLGVSPVIGRWFGEPDREGSLNLAVISSRLWKQLGGNTGILDRTLTLDGGQYTVTGVMPEWFRFPLFGVSGEEVRSDVWVPLNPQGGNRSRDTASYFCYARLKPGVTVAQANADVKRVAAEFLKERGGNPKSTAFVASLHDFAVKEIRPTLLLLFGAAAALLLITCANVAGLLLARSVTRARETAIRIALGATPWQLALQCFAEGLMVALAGAAGGVLVSLGLVRFVLSTAADYLPRADDIAIDWVALVFALGAAILGGVLFSLPPLWQALRTEPRDALSDGVRASAGLRSRRLSRSLVVAEIALAFTLLSVSALLLAHLSRLMGTRPGFDPDHVLTFSLNSNMADYPDSARRASYQQRLIQAIEQIPGVSRAAFVSQVPLAGCCFETSLAAEGSAGDSGTQPVSLKFASTRYFETMRIPLLKGRGFVDSDWKEEHPLRLVINEAVAKRYWKGRDPMGAIARLGTARDRAQVIGIVADVRNNGLGLDTTPEIFFPAALYPVNPMHFVVRSALPEAALIPEIRRAVQTVNRTAPIYEAATMREIVLGSVATERLQSFLTAFFAFAALLMAALGIYGVVSYSVRRRTVEIGTRMALGAVSQDVLSLVIGDGFRMAIYGIAIGGVIVAGATVLLRSQVFGIRIEDARPFLYSTGIVAGFTALACFFPAWRATLVSPMVAIRDDPGSMWAALTARMSGLLSAADAGEDVAEGELMAGFVDSSRHAESYRRAMQLALEALREQFRCASAMLLGKHAGERYVCTARAPGECRDGLDIPAGGLLIGRLKHFPYPLPLSESDLDTWSRWAAAEKPEHLAEIDCLRGTGAALAVPLPAKNEIAGLLLLGAPVGRSRYSAGEKRVLRNCAGQFALMIENARLTDRMLEQEKLRRDLQLATEVQQRLFPDKPPPTAVVTLAGVSLPARGVGGDYYDFLDLGNQRIGIALADVAGKGVPAALIMSVVQASLRIVAEEDIPLRDLAAKMNRFLHRSTKASGYATFFYAEIDERARRLKYVNAGHNPPYLLQYMAPQSIEELPAGGTVIGLFPQSDYEEATVELHSGDVLIAFTDGVPEALNPQEEEFGEDRLKDLLRQCAGLTVDEMASRIAAAMKAWIADALQYDDLTFILMKVT